MKKITQLLIFLLPVLGFSQAHNEKIKTYLNANHGKLELSSKDVADWVLHNEVYADGTKITSCHIIQRYQGIEIYNSQSNLWVKNGEVMNMESNFQKNILQKANTTAPSLSVLQAAKAAYSELGITLQPTFTVAEAISDKSFKLNDGIQEDLISAKLVYQVMPDGKLRLAYTFQFYVPQGSDLWDLRIDALTGKILEKHNLTLSCNFGNLDHRSHAHTQEQFNFTNTVFNKTSEALPAQVNSGSYRVLRYDVISPNHGNFTMETAPHNTLASPLGWHNANSLTGNLPSLNFTFTRGNNVLSQEDINGNDGTGATANGGAALNFDFPYGGTSAAPATYTNAAITNLFYMNNIMHDVWYQYGFNEASGNFQQNNLGRGGVSSISGDAVNADAQDGTSTNNANFSTPNDGSKPRMQMFLWTIGPKFFVVTSPSALEGAYQSVQNAFNPGYVPLPEAPAFFETELVLYMDSVGTTSEACVAPSNAAAMSGKIVIIRRGNCDFVIKVKNAQNAGAIAVIVVDNIPNQLVNMSGADATITIPAVFITKGLGDAIIEQMQTAPVVVKLQSPGGAPFVNSDGDFDNGVIGHEYGHGISNRLMGAGNGACMQNYEQMGEGWSDWFSLMMQIKTGDTGASKRAIGTFIWGDPVNGLGLRSYPYTTDMSVNPLTLTDSNTPVPTDPADTGYRYVMGDVWATVMWDLTWAYIDKYGFDPNIYTGTGGNNKVMRLALDALKLHACNTASFINTRDKLIAADQATTGGQDYCLITQVFARRGMGFGASSGNSNNPNDQVASFTPFPAGPNCTLAVNHFDKNDMMSVYPNPSNGMVTIRINQYSGKANIQVIDINGRSVYSLNDESFNVEKTINLSHLQSGMYVLKVNGETLNYTKKIILN